MVALPPARYTTKTTIIEYVPANYVVGFGQVDKRRIVAAGEDFTLKGGSPNAAGLRKMFMQNTWPCSTKLHWCACWKAVVA